MTDGYVGNQKAIISIIRTRPGNSMILNLGVGSPINHDLLEGVVCGGRGVCINIRQDSTVKRI
ncbi:MAG: hypothetical protein GF398_00540 [Chitinivibrionales bacterium]|nr:hypothetical protein [Chitinivibrionales bacterium]